MGGGAAFCAASALQAALGDAFAGMALIAPALALTKPPAPPLVVAMGLLSAVGLGFLPLGPKDDTANYTPAESSPAGVGRNYPGGMRVGTAVALVKFAAGFTTELTAQRIALPPNLEVLLVTGDQDEVVDVESVREIISSMQGRGSVRGECLSFAGRGHSPVGDEGGHDVAGRIAEFCTSISPHPSAGCTATISEGEVTLDV